MVPSTAWCSSRPFLPYPNINVWPHTGRPLHRPQPRPQLLSFPLLPPRLSLFYFHPHLFHPRPRRLYANRALQYIASLAFVVTMAVIDGLPGVEFTVRINGSEEACTEYDDPDPPRSKVSSGSATHSVFKVIESQDDATFAIHLVVQNRKRWIKKTKGLGVIVYIDGHLVASKAYRHMHCDGKTLQCHFDGIETESANPGMTTIKNFCFSPIKTGMRVLYLPYVCR